VFLEKPGVEPPGWKMTALPPELQPPHDFNSSFTIIKKNTQDTLDIFHKLSETKVLNYRLLYRPLKSIYLILN